MLLAEDQHVIFWGSKTGHGLLACGSPAAWLLRLVSGCRAGGRTGGDDFEALVAVLDPDTASQAVQDLGLPVARTAAAAPINTLPAWSRRSRGRCEGAAALFVAELPANWDRPFARVDGCPGGSAAPAGPARAAMGGGLPSDAAFSFGRLRPPFAQRMTDADVEVRCNAGYGEVSPGTSAACGGGAGLGGRHQLPAGRLDPASGEARRGAVVRATVINYVIPEGCSRSLSAAGLSTSWPTPHITVPHCARCRRM